MYDPTVGRWMEEDPTLFKPGDMNLYRYVRNSPLDATDPSGLAELTWNVKGLGAPIKDEGGKFTIAHADGSNKQGFIEIINAKANELTGNPFKSNNVTTNNDLKAGGGRKGDVELTVTRLAKGKYRFVIGIELYITGTGKDGLAAGYTDGTAVPGLVELNRMNLGNPIKWTKLPQPATRTVTFDVTSSGRAAVVHLLTYSPEIFVQDGSTARVQVTMSVTHAQDLAGGGQLTFTGTDRNAANEPRPFKNFTLPLPEPPPYRVKPPQPGR